MQRDATKDTGGEVRTIAIIGLVAVLAWMWLGSSRAHGAGVLTPNGSADQPIRIIDHQVNVVINNGFARTEVSQTFFNSNTTDLEAIYSFPVPESACLSEMTIVASEEELSGEVLSKEDADRIYGAEKDKGNDAGKAVKNAYQTFEFYVANVRAQSETRMRFVYYEPLKIDTGVGRYVYPLEDGGTDEVAKSFWSPNEVVENTFSADIELKSGWPVADVRMPGFEAAAKVEQLEDGHYHARLEMENASLSRDLVFYYRLADNLPGRVELIPYRADKHKPGTFMLVVTPGIDLQPLTGGADYVFVLDTSGSMKGKIQTLANGVSKALGQMNATDRYRVVGFSNQGYDVTGGWVSATEDNVRETISRVKRLCANGSTNIYDGLHRALRDLDDDRATSVILVTDGVTNTGIIEPKAFHDLLSHHDVRLFGFLMGNNANWPLMRLIAETSGGFYASVSNADDIIGQIMLTKSKVTHECLHDAEPHITGVNTFDVTDGAIGKIYRGQQLVLFGRYEGPGTATVSLDARLTGEDRHYDTTFEFPELDTDNPEIERLWAMDCIGDVEALRMIDAMPAGEAEDAIRDLGVAYQLVTDETSMVVLSDAVFEQYGIQRRNKDRTAVEHQAQAQRSQQPVRNHRVDNNKPMFDQPSHGVGNGGGAIDPVLGAVMLGLAVAAYRVRPVSGPGKANR
ncbi:MAG: VWA domain-containing protein [Phycisphaerae bacterium]|nr:VWA domain-containing protein [Phycisphaerae bacterium]